jgi:phosphatidylglycerol:prolipoprotein diacylglycerol transferase
MPLFALPFPVIDPVALELGPVVIRWYALAYVVGILLGWWLARRYVANAGLWGAVNRPTEAQIDDFILWVTLGIILGGRLGFVVFYNPAFYAANPMEILKVWNGGMSFHGGLIGASLAILYFARGKAFSAWSLFDIVAAVAPIGIFFGRIANFVNAELWGRVTDVSWAMVFPGTDGLPRHPSQLYQAALEGVGLFALATVLVFVGRKFKTPGFITGAFVVGYGIARFIVEFAREPDAQLGYLIGGLTMGQLLSLPMVALGLGIVVWARRARA